MADTLTRRSPLQGFATRFAATAGLGCASARNRSSTMVDLWVDAVRYRAVAAASAMLGVARVADHPVDHCSTAGTSTVIWFGPERVARHLDRRPVARGAGGTAARGGDRARRSRGRRVGAATTLRLRGAHARDVLAKGCSIDLHPRVFGPGAAVQTMLGQAAVVLMPLSDNGSDYRILVRSSFARYLAEWLIDAAGEFASSP